MNFKSKRAALAILGVTSVLCSRAMFFFFNDPEGPNLLIVLVTAAIIYFLSLVVYLFNSPSFKRLLYTILFQVVFVSSLYFCLS